ncbi:hypothetical protein ABID58_001184 [Bradyrhizobium sp. S3.2.6]|uniref:hypothetical protein n=1 Tax=Bradyrhizobium sp. S3.2.6 TaxID=3156428 RepID=UPI00339A0FC8
MKRNILPVLIAAGLLFSGAARAATQLITEEEAKLPPPKGAVAADRRGILRGPKVEFVSPSDSVSSPVHLVLKFESFGGARIDPDSVKVMFLRTPNVDLTARVKPFVEASGINIQDAELPAGEYMVRVDIKDSDGRPGTSIFTLKVAPK